MMPVTRRKSTLRAGLVTPDRSGPAIVSYFDVVRRQLADIETAAVDRLVGLFRRAHGQGRTLFVAGDGGSAALAAHMECDFAKLRAIGVGPQVRSLVDNAALLTMLSNDYGFEELFSRQVATYAAAGDVLLLVSGSGRSVNLTRAAQEARRARVTTFGLLGFGDGGPLRSLVDDALVVASTDYRVVEDVHHSVAHAVAAALSAGRPQAPCNVAVIEQDGVLCDPDAGGGPATTVPWVPGAREAVVALKQAGWTIVVITNQHGVAQGTMRLGDLTALHELMNRELEHVGGHIDAFYVCPHAPDEGCGCRKPSLGLLEAAARKFGVEVSDCVVIGDPRVDGAMGQRAGSRTIVVGAGNHEGQESAPNLARAVELLLRDR